MPLLRRRLAHVLRSKAEDMPLTNTGITDINTIHTTLVTSAARPRVQANASNAASRFAWSCRAYLDRRMGMTEHAFVETPVLYWAVSLAISGRAIAPDLGPPKPIS